MSSSSKFSLLLHELTHLFKPTHSEASIEFSFANLTLEQVRGVIPSGCRVELTGSVAKGTFIRNHRECDIFVLFPRSFPRESLEHEIIRIMELAFPHTGYQLSYAEHPYVRFRIHDHRVDLVPAYQINDASERLSAVDRSVLHTRYIKENLTSVQIDSVILLKAFLKSNQIYGAEIKTQGFSGYLCELLIAKYGNFEKLLHAAGKWHEPLIIDLEKYYKKTNAKDFVRRFGFFVMIDPTDEDRNVAAAVSKENFRKFISLAKSFLKNPSKEFFLRKPETFEEKLTKYKTKTKAKVTESKTKPSGSKLPAKSELTKQSKLSERMRREVGGKQLTRSKRSNNPLLITITMPRPDIVDDVLWGQLRKLMVQLERELSNLSPVVIFADDTRHLVRIALVLGVGRLPPKITIEGPPLNMTSHVQKFRKSHKGAKFTIKKKKIFATLTRSITKAEDVIHDFFRNYAKSGSHLAYPEEILIIERV